MVRLISLTVGPLFIAGAAFLLTRPGTGPLESAASPIAPVESPAARASGRILGDPADSSLVIACQRRRETLMKRLGAGFESVVHPPFVIAGDVTAAELDRHFRETIAPTHRALTIAFFDKAATEPVTIVLVSGDVAYEACANRLDGQTRAAFAGYYERSERRIVINAATGDGTVAHELTHAMAHFDFPDMPEWFDEGLASLHEESRFSEDHLRITGVPNWRGSYLLPALHKGTLRRVESLIGQTRVRPEHQAIDYAHARYFCLFLQERGLLEPFYRKFRAAVADDPSGLKTLRALFGASDLNSIDEEFRGWAVAHANPPGQSDARRRTQDNVPDRNPPRAGH
jgi:hypothetical protein